MQRCSRGWVSRSPSKRCPTPEPLPRFAVVRVGACGICGTDLSITSGRGFLQMPPGFVLGHEYAGEVVAVGHDVERLRVGDHVTALAIPVVRALSALPPGRPAVVHR